MKFTLSWLKDHLETDATLADIVERLNLRRYVPILRRRRADAAAAGRMLGDMGAEVIKIEPPWGEMVRMSADLYGGLSSTFHYLDRNKKDVALNMKDPRALEIIKKLVAEIEK